MTRAALATIVRALREPAHRHRAVGADRRSAAALFNARFDVFPILRRRMYSVTEAPGSTPRVEALVTRLLEGLRLVGAENVTSVRSTSSRVCRRSRSCSIAPAIRIAMPSRDRTPADAAGLLPAGVGPPLLSPLSSSMEYLVHFGFTSSKLSPIELRDLVQWVIKPQILAVPGVAQAQIFGGEARERQVMVDPVKLAAAGFTLDDVIAATRRATALIGGGYIETPTQRIVLTTKLPAPHSRRWGRRWLARVPVSRCASRMSLRCAKAPNRASAMP